MTKTKNSAKPHHKMLEAADHVDCLSYVDKRLVLALVGRAQRAAETLDADAFYEDDNESLGREALYWLEQAKFQFEHFYLRDKDEEHIRWALDGLFWTAVSEARWRLNECELCEGTFCDVYGKGRAAIPLAEVSALCFDLLEGFKIDRQEMFVELADLLLTASSLRSTQRHYAERGFGSPDDERQKLWEIGDTILASLANRLYDHPLKHETFAYHNAKLAQSA